MTKEDYQNLKFENVDIEPLGQTIEVLAEDKQFILDAVKEYQFTINNILKAQSEAFAKIALQKEEWYKKRSQGSILQ